MAMVITERVGRAGAATPIITVEARTVAETTTQEMAIQVEKYLPPRVALILPRAALQLRRRRALLALPVLATRRVH